MQKIIIYNFEKLFKILDEIKEVFYFEIENVSFLNGENKIANSQTDIIITDKHVPNLKDYLILDNLPINIFKFIEKINLELMKKKFSNQSETKVGKYIVNLNSRKLILGKKNLKLTEKETSLILYLTKINKPVNTKDLQKKIWGYNNNLETHTVETHVYRLRKKIFKLFKDNNFIISTDRGYELNLKF